MGRTRSHAVENARFWPSMVCGLPLRASLRLDRQVLLLRVVAVAAPACCRQCGYGVWAALPVLILVLIATLRSSRRSMMGAGAVPHQVIHGQREFPFLLICVDGRA